MIEGILNDYVKVKVGKEEIEILELKERIQEGESQLRIEHRDLEDMTNKELADYFLQLANKCKNKDEVSETAEIPDEVASKDTTQEIAELPDDINRLLSKVADRYEVTPEAIYEQYLDLKELQ